MSRILAGDYGLRNAAGVAFFGRGDEIYAKTTAIGTCTETISTGSGGTMTVAKRSEPHYDPKSVKLSTGATAMARPTAVADPAKPSEIVVCWATPTENNGLGHVAVPADYSYTLLWTNQKAADARYFQRIQVYGQVNAVSGELCYSHRTTSNSSDYTFKVEFKSDCTTEIESPTVEVNFATVPTQPDCRTEVVDCNMQITWNAVESDGAPILRYTIEI